MDVRETGTPVGRPVWSPYTGTHINYYFVCKRKLWLFGRGIQMEQTSDTVLLGKLIDESSYERKDKSIEIEGSIVIDWLDDKAGVIHEVKKSDSMEEAHIWQVLYYLWYLKKKGVAVEGFIEPGSNHVQGNLRRGLKGEIDYPTLKQKVEVRLTPEKERELEVILECIRTLLTQGEIPDRINKRFCKTCSYYDLCWVNQ